MLRVHGRAIMNYQLNHGRFTDDWSICVVRTSTEEEKKKRKRYISLAWKFCPTGSISRNKAGVHHLDWMDFLATWRQINHHIYFCLYFQYSFVSVCHSEIPAVCSFSVCTEIYLCTALRNNLLILIITEDLESFESCENMKLKWARVTWISRISISLRGNEIQYHPW